MTKPINSREGVGEKNIRSFVLLKRDENGVEKNEQFFIYQVVQIIIQNSQADKTLQHTIVEAKAPFSTHPPKQKILVHVG
jgi:hypothetical protein